MAFPEPTEVAPWYLRNINQALALDEASGNVFVRTGFQGNIIITGNVEIPGTVTVNSSAEDPVHVHLDEVGTSGILNVPYMPIGGNVIVTSGNINANVTGSNVGLTGNLAGITGNVNIGTMPAITGNVNANITGGNVNAAVTGTVAVSSISSNVTVVDGGGSLTVDGTVAATQSGSWTVNIQDGGNTITVDGTVGITGNVNIGTMPNINANITGGNVTVQQGTSPWTVAGNVGVTGTVTTVPALSVGDYYGEPYAIPLTPVVQLDGRYGINTSDVQTYTAGAGNVTTSNSCYQVSSTSTVGSYGLLRSKRFDTFKSGQSFAARWFGKFDTPQALTSQRMGLNNQENAYWFGYNNTTFGFLHTYGGRAPIYRITVASYSGAQNVTVTLNSVSYVIAISAGLTTGQVAQQISQSAFGGLWLANQRDNTVELLYTAVGSLGGTFSISGSGTFSGTITQVQAGASATNDWFYAGTDFTLPVWFDPQDFNQYQIKYSWRGVNFFILNPSTGQFDIVYQHIQASSATLETINPAYKIGILALNQGGSTPVTVRAASLMMGLEGITNRNNYTAGATQTATSLSQNVLYQLISIQNPYTFNGTVNTKELLLQDLTVATQCNDPSQIYVFVENIVSLASGVDDFKSQGQLPVTVSKINGTITQDQYNPVATFVVGNTGSVTQFDLNSYRVVVPPGSQATIAILSTAAIQKAASAIVWYND